MADSREALRQLATQIRDEHKLGANTATRVGSLLLALVDAGVNIEQLAKTFIRKDQDDSTAFLLSMLAGAQFGNFVPGIIGAIIDQFGDGEMGSLVLRKFLSIPELRFNRAIVYKGKQIISPGGGCLIESFTLNGNGTWTIVPKLEEGEPLSQEVDDILLAYWHDKDVTTGAFKGFREMKFRVVSADYDAKTFVIAPKPDSLSVPAIAMTLAQVGNFTNKERQTYIMIDSTLGNNNITFFDDCNTWDVEENQEQSWFGKKKGRTVAGIDVSAYSAVLKHVIMTGLIFQIDEISGDLVRVPCDKGAHVPEQRYAYYDRVSSAGALWLCVNEKGTLSTPADGSADWLKQVSEGDKGDAGIGISASDVLYYLSTSPTALEGGDWQTDAPVWQSGKYMWTKTKIVYTDNSTMESTPVCITGGSGKGVSSIVEQYYLSTSPTSLDGGSWDTRSPAWKQGHYVWTRSVVTYTDNTTTTTDAVCVSGSKGDDGESIKMLGHWNSSMRPVPANCMVSYAKGVYLSLRETNQAPVSTLMCANGSYFLNETGGYTLASNETNEDWELILENGKNGVSILFQGSFPAAPANPKDGWSYYNTSDKRSYVYQGGKWYLTSVDGKDGKGFEWIFTRTKTNEKPIALTSEQKDDYVPAGWTDDPVGCTAEYVYEWTCKRTKKDGVWGAYSAASIFNMYSFSTKPQWSTNNADWHDAFAPGDIYIRYSSDGGKTWTDGARFVGETGKDGPYTDFEFAVGESDIQAPANGWLDAPAAVSEGQYLWMRAQYIVPPATVNPDAWKYSRLSGIKGVGIASSDVLYYLSTSPMYLEGGRWQTNAPTWQSGKYMWTKTKIVYTDNSTMESTPVSITGNSGKGISKLAEQYYLSTSSTSLTGGNWQANAPAWKQGHYVWTRSVITYTDNTTTTTDAVCVSGGIGDTGSTGAVGIIPCGHWQSANTPYKKTSLVTMHNATFVALVDTAKPPVWLLKWGPGPTDYLINHTGRYTPLTSVENNRNTEWLMITPPPVNGTDGNDGNDSTSYWLTSPVSTININSVGSLSPSAVLISCKKKKGEGVVSDCSDFFLAARKYNGSWLAHVSSTKASSLSLPAVAGYTQFAVRAYNSAAEADAWGSGFVSEIGVGVSKDGATGDTGPAGSFPRDRGVFVNGTSYVWSPSYRDKVLFPFDGVYYNFLVANYGATVTAAPTSASGDGLWEAMGKYKTFVADVIFAEGANVANFMFKNEVLRSQTETNGVPNIILNGKTGYVHFGNADITGVVNATSGSFKGQVNALSGKIGGFTIERGSLWWKGYDYFGGDSRSVRIGVPTDETSGMVDINFNAATEGRFGVKAVGATPGGACIYASSKSSGFVYPDYSNTYAGFFDGRVFFNEQISSRLCLADGYGAIVSRLADGRIEYSEGIDYNFGTMLFRKGILVRSN